MIDYWKLGIIAGVCVAIFGSGWWVGHQKYVTFKAEVEAVAIKQEAHVESITKQQALVTKSVEKEYEAKLYSLKSYYGGLHNTSSGKLPSISNSSSGINESASDQLLACAYTTQQLVSLQDWINMQIAIK